MTELTDAINAVRHAVFLGDGEHLTPEECAAMRLVAAAAERVPDLEAAHRRLEDACLMLWHELSAEETLLLRDECPDLAEFLAHLHHAVEHEQAMVRVNVWAAGVVNENRP